MEKLESLLSMSLQASKEEREQSMELGVGVFEEAKIFEVIIKHNGDISFLEEIFPRTKIIQLLNGYAVGEIPEEYIELLNQIPQIEYVEKPKLFFFQDFQSISISCINAVKGGENGLDGKGIITAVIDSGINMLLPEFRKENGESRIIALWDQSVRGTGTRWHDLGREYTKEEIEAAIQAQQQLAMDTVDHGTPVTSIACGNNGVASGSDILFVKLLPSRQGGFPRTTQIMMAVDYVLRMAQRIGKPVAINLSLGNNYGAHNGRTILEQYLADVQLYWKTSICVGAGNEAVAASHVSGKMIENRMERVKFAITEYQTSLNLQIWTRYADSFEVRIIMPNGAVLGTLNSYNRIQRFSAPQTEVLGYQGEATPYSTFQETYLDFIGEPYVIFGIWELEFVPKRILEGTYNIWFPSSVVLNQGTGFLMPTQDLSVTIPGTEPSVITVGAYDNKTDRYAPFSGRGGKYVLKPDIVAPGIGIRAIGNLGEIRTYTGTSFATPFVTGSVALLMEWGITNENDKYMYGEKVKAYLQSGARRLPGEEIPNIKIGYGALCLSQSFKKKSI